MTSLAPAAMAADCAESRFRLRAAFLTTLFVFLNFLGVAWDIQWLTTWGLTSSGPCRTSS